MLSTSMALGTVQAAPAKASMSKSTATSEEEDEIPVFASLDDYYTSIHTVLKEARKAAKLEGRRKSITSNATQLGTYCSG